MIEIHIHGIDGIFDISNMKWNLNLYYTFVIYLILQFLFLFSFKFIQFLKKKIIGVFQLNYLYLFLLYSIFYYKILKFYLCIFCLLGKLNNSSREVNIALVVKYKLAKAT